VPVFKAGLPLPVMCGSSLAAFGGVATTLPVVCAASGWLIPGAQAGSPPLRLEMRALSRASRALSRGCACAHGATAAVRMPSGVGRHSACVKGPNMARGGVNSLFKKSTNQLEQFD